MAQKKLKFGKPQVAVLAKRQAALAAKDEDKIRQVHTEHKVSRLIIKGRSIDAAARSCGITTNDAHKIMKDVVARWLTDEAFAAPELREIMVRQMDSVLALAMHEAFPHPMKDAQGRPILRKACICEDVQADGTCIIADHNEPVLSAPDRAWADMVLSVLDRKAKLLGVDKLEQEKVDLLKRMYVGVGQKELDQL